MAESDADAMSLGDHLEELRSRVIRSLVGTVVIFVVIFAKFRDQVMALVVYPYTSVASAMRIDPTLKMMAPAEGLVTTLKVSLIVSLLFAAPLWMYQFWAFVGAGLHSHEKRSAYKFAPPMFLLSGGGVAFGYFVLIPTGLKYLLGFQDQTILQTWISLSEYLTLFTTLTLVLGLTFQLPIIMALLSRLDFVDIATFREKRRIFIFVAFVMGALLTPPDIITQVLLAIPIVLLFELGILFSWIVAGSERPPINWRAWRLRGLVLLVLIAGLFVGMDRLVSAFQHRSISRQVLHLDDLDAPGIPYDQVWQESGLLPFKAEFGFLLKDSDDEERWVVSGDGQAVLLDMTFSDRRVRPIATTANSARFLLNSSVQSVKVILVRERAAGDFMGALINGITMGGDEDSEIIASMALALVGKASPGVPAAHDGDDDLETLRGNWDTWWQKTGQTWVYRFKN